MANRFQFRLDTVLRIRREAQETQQRRVAECVRAVGDIESRIDTMTGQLRESMMQAAGARQAPLLNVDMLRNSERFRTWLHHRIDEANEAVSRRREILGVERERLAEARKRFKVIETLRERRWREYQAWLGREEQHETDEAAAQQSVRARRMAGKVQA